MEAVLAEGGRDARLLAELAEPLEPRRPPFYVKNAPADNADGWYWVAAGADRAQWLGRNVYATQRRLIKLRQEHEQAA